MAAFCYMERLFLQWVYGTTFAAVAGGIWHACRPIKWWMNASTLTPAALLFVSGVGAVWAFAHHNIRQRRSKQVKPG